MTLDDRIEAMVGRVELDEQEIGVLSTGEQIAVAVVLDRRDLVPPPYHESWQDALDRLGDEWLAASRRVAKRREQTSGSGNLTNEALAKLERLCDDCVPPWKLI